MNDTQTAEGWYQSYVEAHKRAVKAEADLELAGKRIEWEADQHAKKCVELEDIKAERDELRVLDEENTAKITELVRSGVEARNEVLDTAIARIKSATTGMHEQDRIGKALEILQAMKEADNG